MDKQFVFYTPTKLFFGENQENNIGSILSSYNVKKVLIVYGLQSVVKSGLLDKVITKLDEEKISYSFLSGVRPNPTIELVRKGIKLLKEEKADFILAIGGGSVMDTAKLMATGYYYDGDPFDISLKKYIPKKAFPLGVICTIAASGSEMSNSCVIQDDILGLKMGYSNDLNRPLFAICNPRLTFSVSLYQTAVGVVDILMHTLERYFSPSTKNEIADDFAIALLKKVMNAGEIAYNDPTDYDARATLMLLSSFSHNGLTSIGKKYILSVHQIEHALSATYVNVSHGAGLAVLFPAWCKYYLDIETEKLSFLGEQLFNLHLKSKKENAIMCIIEFEKYFKKLNMPTTFKELGIDNPDIELMANRFSLNGTRVVDHIGKPLDRQAAIEIYKLAL